jgi:hypothetical protein
MYFNFDVEHPSWRVYTRYIFQFLREESVTSNTFLWFIKNCWATKFRLIKLSSGPVKTWIKKLYADFLNLCFYRACWWLHKPKPSRSAIFNKAKKNVCCDWFFSEELKYLPCISTFRCLLNLCGLLSKLMSCWLCKFMWNSGHFIQFLQKDTRMVSWTTPSTFPSTPFPINQSQSSCSLWQFCTTGFN